LRGGRFVNTKTRLNTPRHNKSAAIGIGRGGRRGLATVLFVEQCARLRYGGAKKATTTVAMVLSTVTGISSSTDAVAP
jgi:hypothetical protein